MTSSQLYDLIVGGQSTHAGPSVTEDNAMRSSAVYACIRIISESIASLPLVLYKQTGRNKSRATTHPLYPVLHDMANPEITAFEWRELVIAHTLLRGNSWSEKEFDTFGVIKALWPLNPAAMEGYDRRNGELHWLYRLPDNKLRSIPNWRIHHIKGLGDGIQGYSPIRQAARQAVGLSLAAEEYGARFYSNGARPGLILRHPGKLSSGAAERLKTSFATEHQGLSNAHRTKILEEGMDVTTIGIPNNEAQFLEIRKFQVTEIARIYRVPPHMLADLDRATFCLPADAEVYTAEGPKRIVDVQVGDPVWSWDGSQYVQSRVLRSACTGNDEILELRTTNRLLRANAKHRVLVRRKYLDPQVGQGGYQSVEWRTEYVPAGELQVGDTLVTLDNLPEGERTEINGRALTVGFMEFCGLLLGDGNVIRNKGITIARAENALYMDHYREVMQEEFVSFGRNGNGKQREKIATQPVTLSEGGRQTRFASVLAAEELTTLELSGKARSKSVPAWVFETTNELKLAFLRGYLDADGSVDKMGRIAYHSVNRHMLSQMRHLCMSLDIPVTNLRHQIIKTTLPNGELFDGEIYSFTCSDPGANRRIGSYDPRYQVRFQEGKPFGRKGRAYPRYGGKDFEANGCGLSRINSIQRFPDEPVYDLEVEGTHSFIADGVVVHNSNIEQQSINFVVYTLMPWLVRHEKAIYRDLLSESERKNLFAKYIVEGMLRGDSLSRYQSYQLAINNTILTPNEIRELEDRNPVEGGDVLFTPLNMIELGKEPPAPMPAPGSQSPPKRNWSDQSANQTAEQRAAKASADRRALMLRNVRLFEDAVSRVVTREVTNIRKAAKFKLGKRDADSFETWLEGFYRQLREWFPEYFRAIMLTYAESIMASVAAELDGEPAELNDELREWVDGYLANYTAVYAVGGEKQLKTLLAESEGDEDAAKAIEERMVGWEETKATKEGFAQAFEAGNALAIFGYVAGGVSLLRWSARGESCPLCRKMDGKRIKIGGSFFDEGDTLKAEGVDPLPIVRTIKHGPLHGGCLLGDSLILSGQRILAASKRRFDGDVVVIQTANGHKLTCTPNHPILTRGGWVAAGLLNIGNSVISHGGGEWRNSVDRNDKDVPTRIEDVVEAFGRSEQVVACPVPVTAENFHGDGEGSKVAIIWANRLLVDGIDTSIEQHSAECPLISGDSSGALLSGFGRQTLFREGLFTTFGGDMSGGGLSHAFSVGHFAGAHKTGGAMAAGGDVMLQQSAPDSSPRHAEFERQGIFGLPAEISIDEIVDVRKVEFSGHVYNLQTETGWYVADSIITHNCDCTVIAG